MASITFGTDGWRAVVGEDFTPENVRKVTQAFCDLYAQLPEAGRPVIVGYDRRNQSPESARLIAEVLVGNDIAAVLANNFCPTPAVSWMTVHEKAAAGIMVTASHNPPHWNGIKFKESYGGAASGDYVKPIEDKIAENEAAGREPKVGALEGNDNYSQFDPYGPYLHSFEEFIDIEKIRAANFKILMDPLYGSGTGFMPQLLGACVEEIHNEADVNFGGVNPEPIPPHINELLERMKSGSYDCGMLTDGDADRAGAVDENGNFITTHEVYALILKHIVENKKWSGKIIKSISTTMMINRLGAKYNLPVTTVQVGFKYISPAMKEPGVLIGGEESGGYGMPRHIPERDGVFSDLLLLELMATKNKSLGKLVQELQEEVGPCRYKRLDLRLTADQIARVRDVMKTFEFSEIGGRKVKEHTTIDGHHFLFEDDSWLLFRASGTEPLIRLYSEAPTMGEVESLIEEGKKKIGIS